MAKVGDIDYKFRRNYIAVNPAPELGPITWRLAAPQEVGAIGGSDGGSVMYEFEGVPPMIVATKPGEGEGGRTLIETSMDIQQLESRQD